MKVLVTGAGGLIGFYAARALHGANNEVIALYRKFSDKKERYAWRIIEADLLDHKSEFILAPVNVSVVVHCAAVLPKQFEGEEATRVAEKNKRIDDKVLKFCQEKSCSLVYISSTSVYGSTGFPWDEKSSVSPWGAYAISKYETEQKISERIERFVIMRISAPYAPEQRTKTVLQIFIERALENRNLYYHGTGKRQQDFTAAGDVAKAIVCAVSDDSTKGVFNIAGGRPISMKNLATLIIQNVPKTTSQVLPSGDPDLQEKYRALFDINKARDALGWNPSISLESGIQRWVRYLEKIR